MSFYGKRLEKACPMPGQQGLFLPLDLKQRASEELSYMTAKQRAPKDPKNHSVNKRQRNTEVDDSEGACTGQKRARALPAGDANPSFDIRSSPAEYSTAHDHDVRCSRTAPDGKGHDGGGIESWSQDVRTTTLPTSDLLSSMMRSPDAPGSSRAAENQIVGPSGVPLSETQGSRSTVRSEPTSIMDMPECGHGMEVALEMTVKIAGFFPVIDGIRTILALVGESEDTLEQFNITCLKRRIYHKLRSIDETRCNTWVRAAESVLRCLPAYRDFATDRFPAWDHSKLDLWMRKHCWPSSPRFESELETFLAVTLPYAMSMDRLASTQPTPQDVVRSWLEVQKEIYQALNDEELLWPDMATKEEVHNILSHKHFTELFYDDEGDAQTTGQYVDPELRDVRMYRPVFFNRRKEFGHMACECFSERPTLFTLVKWRTETYLLCILHRYYLYDRTRNNGRDIMQDRDVLLSSLAADVARQQLRAELKAFARRDHPFNRRYDSRKGKREWWLHVQKKDGARVLGALVLKIHDLEALDITASSESVHDHGAHYSGTVQDGRGHDGGGTESWLQDARTTTLPTSDLLSSMTGSQDTPGSSRPTETPFDASNQTIGAPLSETQGSRSTSRSEPMSIMDMPDRGYGMEIALEMTAKIAGFSPVIDGIRTILALVNESEDNLEQFNSACRKHRIYSRLRRIDETRCSELVLAADSVLDCLPAYRDFATDRFPAWDHSKLDLWMRKHCWPSSPRFEAELETFLAVTLPYAISIDRFTSTQPTPQDVVRSWLEVQEEIYQALNDEELSWPDMATKEEVHDILSHKHFTELFYDHQGDRSTIDMYLDPKLRDVRIYRPVVFNRGNEFGLMADKFLEETTARLRLPTLARWRTETKLLSILHRDYFTSDDSHDIIRDINPLLSSLAADVARQQLRAELKAFARRDRPFNRRYNFREEEMRWWLHVQKEDGARVLGALVIAHYDLDDGVVTASSESEDEESAV
ncbi:hypothetical protein WOLCODRAFT_166094 [Wolfiporia cocos MD-104 SS10]|uniref:Uncharacterized protein n=1 Tax=Wolfiporia cocos (strain MD-104) TaxID=742152 RepID=A0A2H3IZL5_WOLCO|nr:hypothetical protein WOLCODRAFT_166094 [Wolfiporia cocos MD-104 SS10]